MGEDAIASLLLFHHHFHHFGVSNSLQRPYWLHSLPLLQPNQLTSSCTTHPIKLAFRLLLLVHTLTCGNAQSSLSLVCVISGASLDEQSFRSVKNAFFDVCGSVRLSHFHSLLEDY